MADHIPSWRRYLRFWRRDIGGDVSDEVRFHIEALVDELRARSMNEDDARRVAVERFGDVPAIAASMRALAEDRQSSRRRTEVARNLWSDLRYAFRSLRRSGGTIAAVVVTLAVGLGVTAATFSLLDQLFWRPPAGVANAGEVHRVWFHEHSSWDGARHARAVGGVPQIATVREALAATANVGVYIADTAWRVGASGQRARVGFANRAWFEVLGITPARGRLFEDSEDVVTTPAAVAVVSGRFAERWLADSAQAIGSVVELQGEKYTVIGVTPDDFVGVDLQPTEVWLPLGSYRDDPRMRGVAVWYERGSSSARALVRLPDRMGDAALADVATARLRAMHRERGWRDTLVAVSFAPAIGVRGPGETRPEVRVATRVGVVGGIILLIACANVANLFLARAVQRRREFGIRAALGISRARLVGMLTVESAVLGVAAALLTAVITWWAGEALRALLFPGLNLAGGILHWRVALLALALAFAASWVVSVLPALQVAVPASRAGSAALRVTSGTSESRTGRIRATLTVAQVAFSFMLLTAAAAFLVSLQRIQSLDIGFDAARTVSAEVVFEDLNARPAGAVRAEVMRRAKARVERMPGVEAVALGLAGPMSGSWVYMRWFAAIDSSRRDGNSESWPVGLIAEPAFFDATGLRLREGRTFRDAPVGGVVGEVVVNESMARVGWEGGRALGGCMYLERRSSACARVVGIVEDSPRNEVLEGARPMFFLPLSDWEPKGWEPSALVARVDPGARGAVVGELRRLLQGELPTGMPRVSSLEEALAPQFRQWRLGATLFGCFGVLALLVTIAGVYSTTSYGVAQRAREFGIRIALGARRRDVLGAVFRRVAGSVGAGLVAGGVAALAVGRVIQGLLYDVSALDPRFLALAAALLIVAGCVAALGPAVRASRENPMTVMRGD